MPARRTLLTGLVGLAAVQLSAGSALAAPRTARFSAVLRGDAPPANTDSKATGAARLVIDLDAQSVDLQMTVVGIGLAQLWDKLKAAPIGPVHVHRYGDMRHMNDPSVSLVLPAPFGPMYTATADGFALSMKGFPYAKGAALLGSPLSFDGFVSAMQAGLLALNVHTNAFTDGEINGPLLAA